MTCMRWYVPGWVSCTRSDRVKHSSEVRFGYRWAKSVESRKWESHLVLVQHDGRSGMRSDRVYVVIGWVPSLGCSYVWCSSG